LIKVYYDTGKIEEYDRRAESPECELIVASYLDDFNEVKRVVELNKNILDINALVLHSPTRGNGTALILTGDERIAQYLLDNGAHINKVYDTGSAKITALDSALAELEKNSIKSSPDKLQKIKDLISTLRDNGAKKFKELNHED